MLNPHTSASLEYWFFKLNTPEVALIVDWICRRQLGSGVLRTSVHSPVAREVLFTPHPAILRHGAPELAMAETSWPRGDVRWDLAIRALDERIRPQLFPAEQLRMFDMSLVSAPSVFFDGWIEHRGDRFPVEDARGMISHYWGRQLPPEWWWLSANLDQGPDASLEATILHTHVWGTPLLAPLGYLYYRVGPRRRLLLSPPGRLTVTGTPESFTVSARPLRGPKLTIKATGRDFGSFGEGILNTLTGDLALWEGSALVGEARGNAALERRAPPAVASA